MAGVRQSNTDLELALRRKLFAEGYRYRVNVKGLPGRPDLVFTARRKVIFVHGCFWHAHLDCRLATVPKTRTAFWLEKFAANRLRDGRVTTDLEKLGWQVLTVWQCELQNAATLPQVKEFLGAPRRRIC